MTSSHRKVHPAASRMVPEDKEILNAAQAGAVLGVSERLILRLAREGAIPAQKIGREWRFLRSALRNHIAGGGDLAGIQAAFKKAGIPFSVGERKKRKR